MASRILVCFENGRFKQRTSSAETLDFLGVRIGSDNLPITEKDSTAFDLGAKRLANIADAVSGYDAVSLSQLTTALAGKVDTSVVGVSGGICPLDGSGKVASAYLPSYVDDVIEAADFASLPGTGETGKIYVTLDTGKIYRWSGSAYVEISPSPGSTDAVTEGSTNLYFTEARVRATVLTGLSAAAGGTLAATDTVLQAFGKLEYRVALNDAKVSYSAATARADLITQSISSGVSGQAPSSDAVFTALGNKSDVGHGHIAANISDFTTAAQTAAVVNTTSGNETVQAPSVSAVKSYVQSQIGSSVSKSFTNKEGSAITIRQFVFESAAGEVQLAQANDAITPDTLIGCVKDTSIDNDVAGEIYLPCRGVVIGGFSGLNVGQPIYLSRTTAGSYQQNTTGFVAGEHLISLGKVISASEIVFEPAYVIEY